MIDGGIEALEQEFTAYLLPQGQTTPVDFANHFHLSDRSAAYWLGCLVKSGRVRIARIENLTVDEIVDSPADDQILRERSGRPLPQAVPEVTAREGDTGSRNLLHSDPPSIQS